eukprot:gene50503-61786_t
MTETRKRNNFCLDLYGCHNLADHKDSLNFYDTARSYGTTDNESGDVSVEDMEKLNISMKLSSEFCSSPMFTQTNSSVPMEDDEYGFYDQCDQLQESSSNMTEDDSRSTSVDHFTPLTSFDSFKQALGLASPPSSTSSNASAPSSSSSSSFSPKSPASQESHVLCVIENLNTQISCRSFDGVTVCVSIGGVRVVQLGCAEEAEYKFVLSVDGQEYVCWKSYQHFKVLAEACMQSQTHPMSNTIKTWYRVVNNRPWWSAPVHNLPYLTKESRLLEVFMKNLLFE